MMGKISTFMVLGLVSLFAGGSTLPPELSAKYFQTSFVNTDNGVSLEKVIISSPPKPPLGLTRASVSAADLEKSSVSGTSKTLTTPAFEWSFGCAATAAAMVAGYYDRNGYPNIYTGPTNGGLMPLDSSSWPTYTYTVPDGNGGETQLTLHQSPLSATHKGLDGRTTKGHVDDYWVKYDDAGQDPYQSGGWAQHIYGDCTADYMRTNQAYNYYDNSNYGNSDAATTFYLYTDGTPLTASDMEGYGIDKQDGAYGFKKFIESRGYQVETLYTQRIDAVADGGFTFDQYKAEIDAGHPVLIHVEGHMMTGVGYNTDSNKVYLHDTWDFNLHEMTWGGSYSGMTQYGITVIHLKAPDTPKPETQFYMIPAANGNAAVISL